MMLDFSTSINRDLAEDFLKEQKIYKIEGAILDDILRLEQHSNI